MQIGLGAEAKQSKAKRQKENQPEKVSFKI